MPEAFGLAPSKRKTTMICNYTQCHENAKRFTFDSGLEFKHRLADSDRLFARLVPAIDADGTFSRTHVGIAITRSLKTGFEVYIDDAWSPLPRG